MSSTLNHRARHNPYLPCLHCYRTLICIFVFSSELKFNSSWKWQPSWSLKLAYLSQLARSRTACVAGPCWHTILAIPLAFSTPSSPGRLLSSTFLLCPCWLPPKQPCSPKQIFIRHCTGFSSGTRLPSFLEREALSVLTGWSLHLPPRGFRGPSQDRLSLLQQLPTGASGRPAASEEPARWEQQVKGSENYINTGTRSH